MHNRCEQFAEREEKPRECTQTYMTEVCRSATMKCDAHFVQKPVYSNIECLWSRHSIA